jgi:Cys-tRNA(Pro)/Cys-tRNA(Cys) deacylase
MNKTNAIRILEQAGVSFNVVEYDAEGSFISAVDSARKAGENVEQVYKTIAFKNASNELFIFVLESEMEVSLKKARALSGCDIEPVRQQDLKGLTGYERGCCSPLGLKKAATIFIDELALLEPVIYVSCGAKGMNVGISPEDLCKISGALFADFAS